MQLLGLHREISGMRGLGWCKKHSVVNYVFNYSPLMLYDYHILVMAEMVKRGYKPNLFWYITKYRGKTCNYPYSIFDMSKPYLNRYTEHNEAYYIECIENLKRKGVII